MLGTGPFRRRCEYNSHRCMEAIIRYATRHSDGYSFIQGDRNDANPAIHPGAVGTLNGLDDDCNGIVDDLTVVEGAPFPSSPATSLGVTLPIRIVGQNDGVNSDFFHLDVTNDCSLNVEIASLDSGLGGSSEYIQRAGF